MVLTDDFLYIPVKIGTEEKRLEIFCGEEKVFEFMIPQGDISPAVDFAYDYVARIPAQDYRGRELTFRGDFPDSFFVAIEKAIGEYYPQEKRPSIHFTSKYGWINDPNGLIFDGETFHMYFQHNPFNIKWENMSWGCAKTTDLLHYTQYDDVLLPDARGTIFSGCGLIHNGEFLFPYTVAGTSSNWSDGKPFYQGLARSTDGGRTLTKDSEPFLGITGKDSRDPKIFWHEESQAYVMVLYLEKRDFGIFRSKDLKNWEKTQHINLEKDKAWECPDLLPVRDDEDNIHWMFFCADGFYYWGDFDGYTFTSDYKLHHAYFNSSLYATQTYFGTTDRIVAVPWLRFEARNGGVYQGAMGIPREYTCKKQGDDYILQQKPCREFFEAAIDVEETPADGAYMVELAICDGCELMANINGTQLTINPKDRTIRVGEEINNCPEELADVQLIVDYNILEITVANAIIGAYVIEGHSNEFSINWRENGDTKGRSGRDGAHGHYSIKSIK